ncbi:MAG: hypothetical protein U0167_16600 [bacterium]
MTPRLGLFGTALVSLAAVLFVGCGDSNSPTAPAPPDTTPPAVPAGVQLAAAFDHLQVTWAANSEPDLAGYLITQSTDDGATWTEATAAPLTTNAFDTAACPQIQFRVSAVDLSSNESAPSAAVGYHAPNRQPKFPAQDQQQH